MPSPAAAPSEPGRDRTGSARAIVFAGPTLCRDPAKEAGDIAFLPPAANGDVYRATLRAPVAIGLVDGFFETMPAVWHKEILFALSRGVHVFGAASMGALRAAELWRFGMVGVGDIFEAYRDGRIEDDDEVAVIHAPAELDYLPLSEAMVNVRATLDHAAGAGIVGAAAAETLTQLAKATFYKDRTWARLLDAARGAGVAAEECAALAAWLPRGHVDRKRLDAHAMLAAMRALLAADAPPFRADFEFIETVEWRRAVRDFEAAAAG